MRKLICILLILCLAFALSANVLAAEFANMYELLMYWEENGYPDDVGSIYSSDGSAYNFTVQLVGDDISARSDELRAMLDDPSTVTFEKGTFTDKQLHEISNEIAESYMTEDSGIQSVAVGWGSNGKGFGVSGKEMRVVVVADEDRAVDLYQELGSKYGEAVIVEAAKGELEYTEQTPAEPEEAAEPAADAEPAAEPEPEAKENKISEQTETKILEITFIVMGALAAFLIIFLRRRKNR